MMSDSDFQINGPPPAYRSATQSSRQNNWPPLPDKCCVGPCFYHDITVDIPLEFQKVVKAGYYLWIYHTVTLIINVIGALCYLAKTGYGVTFGMALLYMVLFVPLSFICWFRPVYKAFRSDSSFNFFLFFFIFFFQFCVSVAAAVGIPGVGSCGYFNGVQVLNSSKGIAFVMIIVGVLFTIEALCCFALLVKIHRIYRSSGASFAKAQAELTSDVMRNEHVQNTVAQEVANPFGVGQNKY